MASARDFNSTSLAPRLGQSSRQSVVSQPPSSATSIIISSDISVESNIISSKSSKESSSVKSSAVLFSSSDLRSSSVELSSLGSSPSATTSSTLVTYLSSSSSETTSLITSFPDFSISQGGPTEFEFISTEIIYKTFVSDNYTSTSTSLHVVTIFNTINPSATINQQSSSATKAGELITSSPADKSSNSTPTPTSTIVGSTIGSFAGVALIGVFAFLLFARQRKKNRHSDGTSKNSDLFFNVPPPVISDSTRALANDSAEDINYNNGLNDRGNGNSFFGSLFSLFPTRAALLPKNGANENNIDEKSGVKLENRDMDYNIFYRKPRRNSITGPKTTTATRSPIINTDRFNSVDTRTPVISESHEEYSSSGDESNIDNRDTLSRNENSAYYRPHSYNRDSQISDDLTTVNSIQAGEEDYYYALNENETSNDVYRSETPVKTSRYPLTPQTQLRVVNADDEIDLSSILEESETEPESDNELRYDNQGRNRHGFGEFDFEQSILDNEIYGDDLNHEDQSEIYSNIINLDIATNNSSEYDLLNPRAPSVLGSDVSAHRSGFFSETGSL